MTPPSAHRTRWANAKATVSASDPSSPNGSHATLVRKSKWARPSWPARILHVPHAFSLALNDRPKPEHNTHRTRDGAEINALPPPPPPTPPPNSDPAHANGSQTPSRVASGVANTVDPTAYTVCAGGGVLPGRFGNPAIPCGATFRNPPLDSILERASSWTRRTGSQIREARRLLSRRTARTVYGSGGSVPYPPLPEISPCA